MSNIKCSICKLFFESIKKPNGECYKRCDICREKQKEYYKLNASKSNMIKFLDKYKYPLEEALSGFKPIEKKKRGRPKKEVSVSV